MMKLVLSIVLLIASKRLLAIDVRGYSLAIGRAQTPLLRSSPRTLGLLTFENINRINLIKRSDKSLQFELGIDINQVVQKIDDPLLQRDFTQQNYPYRIDNPDPRLSYSNSTNNSYYALKQVDRLFIGYSYKDYDLTVGRQQIAFGSAKLINPTDLFSPFAPSTINQEERNGVDAIRLRKSLGANSELDFGILLGEKTRSTNNAFYFRAIIPLKDLELKPILARYQEALGIGVDLLIPVKGANLYLESMSTKANNLSFYNRTTLGVEYQFNDNFFFIIEYHFNGAGQDHPADYDITGQHFALSKGGGFLLGRHYFNLMLSYQLTALHMLGLSSYQNLSDSSNLLSPSWEWSLSDNTSLITGIILGLGIKTDSPLLINSEFGSYGSSFYTKLIYFF